MLNKYKIIIILLTILFLISAFTSLLFYRRFKQMQKKSSEQPVPNRSLRLSDKPPLLSEIEKLLVLPEEKPNILNVSDLDNLIEQPFFTGAKPTDIVLLYKQEKKAILYDPVAKQIINIGPLIIVTPTIEAHKSN